MGTPDGRYAVDTDGLARHAQDVAALGERLENAAKYAQPLSADAFGLVGQLFTAKLIETSGVVSGSVTRLGTHARADQAALYASLSDYLAHESRTARALSDAGQGGPRDTGPPRSPEPNGAAAPGHTLEGSVDGHPTYRPGSISEALNGPGAGR